MTIIANSDEMRRFARILVDITTELQTQKTSTIHRLEDLKRVWRDQKFREFEPAFLDTTREIDVFVRAATEYAKFLQRKAQKIDRFLS
jgi:uncharacterized protein YukE